MRRPDAVLYGEIGLDTSKFQRGIKQADGALRGLSGAMTAFGTALSVYGLQQLTNYAFELGQIGAQSLRLRASFEELAKSHQGNSQALLDALKRASQGAISETNLILGANRAMMLGLGADAEQLGKLMEVAAFRARAMGITTTQAWNDIVTGIGRKSPLILDNLGIVGLKMDENTSKSQIMAQVISQGQKMIAEAGGVAADAMTDFERLGAKTEDLKAKLGELWVKTNIPNIVVDFVSQGAEGWINTLDYLQIIDEWAAKEHKTTLRVIAEKTVPEIAAIPGEGMKGLPPPENLEKYWAAPLEVFDYASEKARELVRLTERVHQMVSAGVVDVQNWGDAWADTPKSLDEFAMNFAILDARLKEGLISVEQYRHDWGYVAGQLEEFFQAQIDAERELARIRDVNAQRYQGYVDEWYAQMLRVDNVSNDVGVHIGGITQQTRLSELAALRLSNAWSDVGVSVEQATSGVGRFFGKVKNLDYGDYSTAEQFGPKAVAQANLALLDLDVTIVKAMERANRSAADDFRAKMEGANNIIAQDITEKVERALGIIDPTRGGPLDRGDAPGEWWRRLPDIIKLGEDSPHAEQMRGDIARIADYLVGPGAGEKVLADEGAMRAGAEAIQRFAEQFGYAGAAGAIELNAGVVTIDWQQAAAAMERETGLEKAVVGGEAYAAQQMGLPVTGLAVPTGVPGATAAAPGAEGGIAGSGYAVMAQDAQVLAEILQTVLMPQLTVVNDFFVTQLNLNIGVANTLLGTDIPNSITTATGSFTSFVSDALEPTTSAAAALNEQLQGLIDKLRTLADMDLGDFQPGSPTPFELGLRGINEELAQMGGAWGMITPLSGGGSAGPPLSIHLHVGAMLGREADAYRLANELLPYLNRARRVQRWD